MMPKKITLKKTQKPRENKLEYHALWHYLDYKLQTCVVFNHLTLQLIII